MIIVLGSVKIRTAKMAEALAVAQQHVLRSRAEPGCLEHGVHKSQEQEDLLVFIERWNDMAALQAHFQVPESKLFVQAMSAMAVAPPSMSIYDAAQLQFPGSSAA